MKLPLFYFIVLILASCSNKKNQNLKSNNTLETELDSLFANTFSDNEPGGSILVKKGGEILYLRSYGIADLKTKEKITENTVFNTGSISKTFVSNGILILEEQGLLSLEDEIKKYFDDFDNEQIAGIVKIKHLLSHTSGLPDLRNVRDNFEFYLTAKDKENFEPLKHADSLNFEPGEKFQYSNPAFNGLALIIEKLSKQKWQIFIEDNIFEPAGMTNSKITDGAYPQDGVAHAYIFKEGEFVENDYGEFPTFAAAGNGGIWSSVLDLAKYEKAIQQNTWLSNELTNISRTVFRPQNWSDTINPFIGYSWFIGEETLLNNEGGFNVKMVFNTGSQGGFRAFYITIPEKDILYIGLFNRPIKDFRKMIKDGITLMQRHNWVE